MITKSISRIALLLCVGLISAGCNNSKPLPAGAVAVDQLGVAVTAPGAKVQKVKAGKFKLVGGNADGTTLMRAKKGHPASADAAETFAQNVGFGPKDGKKTKLADGWVYRFKSSSDGNLDVVMARRTVAGTDYFCSGLAKNADGVLAACKSITAR